MFDDNLNMIMLRHSNFRCKIRITEPRNVKIYLSDFWAVYERYPKIIYYLESGGIAAMVDRSKCEFFVFLKSFIKDNICTLTEYNGKKFISIPPHEDMGACYFLICMALKHFSLISDLEDTLKLCNNYREIYAYLKGLCSDKRSYVSNGVIYNRYKLSNGYFKACYKFVINVLDIYGDMYKFADTKNQILKLQEHKFAKHTLVTDDMCLEYAKNDPAKDTKVRDIVYIDRCRKKFHKLALKICKSYIINQE